MSRDPGDPYADTRGMGWGWWAIWATVFAVLTVLAITQI
jgi:hypothetical protein